LLIVESPDGLVVLCSAAEASTAHPAEICHGHWIATLRLSWIDKGPRRSAGVAVAIANGCRGTGLAVSDRSVETRATRPTLTAAQLPDSFCAFVRAPRNCLAGSGCSRSGRSSGFPALSEPAITRYRAQPSSGRRGRAPRCEHVTDVRRHRCSAQPSSGPTATVPLNR
jgi:hypothetical protein